MLYQVAAVENAQRGDRSPRKSSVAFEDIEVLSVFFSSAKTQPHPTLNDRPIPDIVCPDL